MALPPALSPVAFLAGDGEMAQRMRAFDWRSTALGAPEDWSPSLKAMVRMALTTRHPIYIFWGPELIGLYNDAYSASLGPEKHPAILGAPGRSSWLEIWDIIGPQIDTVMRGEGATWNERQLVPITRHGGLQDVYWTYSYGPIDEAGAPHGVGGVLVICTETTEQVQLERRLATERENFAQLFEQSPTFMAMLRGPQHRFELANPAYLALVGQRRVLGRTVAEALPESVGQGYLRLLDEVYASGRAFTANDYHYEQGSIEGGAAVNRYVDFVYQPILDAAGQVTGIFVQGVDVTARHEASEELRLAAARILEEDRRKTEFLATLAHELRNPLAPLRTGLEILRRGAGTAPAPALQMMERQLLQMVHLVNDLMDISRISSGKVLLRRERFDLREALGVAVETSRPLVDAKQHVLSLDLGAEPLPVDADRLRLAQVVSNLLNNAAKYTQPGGRIVLRAYRDGLHATVEVADSGIGIPADALESVFEMFAQAPGEAHAREGGLGIGLALARRLVEMHGGTVSASSVPGQGSVLHLRVPLEAPGEGAVPDVAGSADAAPAPSAPQALRVLVTDDNHDAAVSLCEVLQLLGHSARHAADGQSALRLAPDYLPELAILDIGMPDMDGYELAGALRRIPGLEHLFIVALTGWGNEEDRLRARAAGFDAHLTKPADLTEIQRILDGLGKAPVPARR